MLKPQPQGQGQGCPCTWKRFHLCGMCRSLQHPGPCPLPPPTPASRGSFYFFTYVNASTTQCELGGPSLELCISILPSGWEAFSAPAAAGRLGLSGGCGLVQSLVRCNHLGLFSLKSQRPLVPRVPWASLGWAAHCSKKVSHRSPCNSLFTT